MRNYINNFEFISSSTTDSLDELKWNYSLEILEIAKKLYQKKPDSFKPIVVSTRRIEAFLVNFTNFKCRILHKKSNAPFEVEVEITSPTSPSQYFSVTYCPDHKFSILIYTKMEVSEEGSDFNIIDYLDSLHKEFIKMARLHDIDFTSRFY